MAKDILEKLVRLSWDDNGGTPRDLSVDLVPGSLTGPGFTAPEIRMTGVADTVENYQADRQDSEVAAQFYLDDTLLTGAYPVLRDTLGIVGTLTVQFGTTDAPTTGDPEFEGEHMLMETSIAENGGAIVINARWKPASETAPAWGLVA